MARSMGGLAVLLDLALGGLFPSMSRMVILPGGLGRDTNGGHQIAIDAPGAWRRCNRSS